MNIALTFNACASLLFGLVALYVWRHRPPSLLWPSLLLVQLLALLWIGGDSLTHLAGDDMVLEQVGIFAIYAGSSGMVAAWWVLWLRFAESLGARPRWASTSVERAPIVLAALVTLAALTNPWHGQLLTPVLGGRNEYHWLWYTLIVPAHLCLLASAVGYAHLRHRFDDAPATRRQCAILLLATLSGIASNAAYTWLPIDWPLDLTIAGGLLTGLLFVAGIYRGKLFDLSPLALNALLEEDPVALLIVSAKGRLLYANASAHALFGDEALVPYAPVEPLLRSALRPPEPGDSRFSLEQARRALREGERGAHYLMPNVGRGTSRLWVSVQALGGRSGSPSPLALRLHDVTQLHSLESELQRMEQHLARADRLRSLGVLAAGIAHEVNNPVGSSLLSAEYALRVDREAGSDQERLLVLREALHTTIEQNQRAARVTRNMLRFAREGSGERVAGDLRPIVHAAIDLTHTHARQTGAYVGTELPEALPLVDFNAIEIEQVLVNLLHNAMTSGKPGRHVQVAIHPAVDCAQIVVTDDGEGMGADETARAFEPFYSARRGGSGTGLGLSVVHGNVSDHDGRVFLESARGVGNAVTVELPWSRSGVV